MKSGIHLTIFDEKPRMFFAIDYNEEHNAFFWTHAVERRFLGWGNATTLYDDHTSEFNFCGSVEQPTCETCSVSRRFDITKDENLLNALDAWAEFLGSFWVPETQDFEEGTLEPFYIFLLH